METDDRQLRLFYTISEVSKLTGIKPYILRYWEKEFTKVKPLRERGRRSYRSEDIHTIMLIKKLLYEEGYTIAGAKIKLKEEIKKEAKTPKDKKILDLKKQLQELLKIVKDTP